MMMAGTVWSATANIPAAATDMETVEKLKRHILRLDTCRISIMSFRDLNLAIQVILMAKKVRKLPLME